jgi:hypothetical protein
MTVADRPRGRDAEEKSKKSTSSASALAERRYIHLIFRPLVIACSTCSIHAMTALSLAPQFWGESWLKQPVPSCPII